MGVICPYGKALRGLGRSRRALVLTPLIIVLNALLIWTLEHTDIVAFATIFVAALVLVSGTFWATGPATNRKIAPPTMPPSTGLMQRVLEATSFARSTAMQVVGEP